MFKAWPKTPRWENETFTITEKIDGTNACVVILPDKRYKDGFNVFAQSRTKIITPGKTTDNFGFAQWVEDNRQDLLKLGVGRHYGEWWGQGIQRTYGLKERKFSLFRHNYKELPMCCDIAPILTDKASTHSECARVIEMLKQFGSVAQPLFMNPEGIIIQSNTYLNVRYKWIINK